MKRVLRKFISDRSGATVIEYALIASIVSLSILASLPLIGAGIVAKLTTVIAAF